MKVTGISVIIGALGTVTEGIRDLEIRGLMETI